MGSLMEPRSNNGATDPADQTQDGPLSCSVSGKGPRVVLVHGFTQTGATMSSLARALAVDHEVACPDLPGHGASPPARGDLWSAAAAVADCGGTAAYLGYSLGGRVCLHLALAQPRLVERLVLISATAGIEDEAERSQRREADEALAARIEEGGDAGVPSFLSQWLEAPLFRSLNPDAADLASRRSNRAVGLSSSLRCHGTGHQPPLWGRLGDLEMPVLVVAGSRDGRFVEYGRRIALSIGDNARFIALEDAGHAVFLEQPDELAHLVTAFLTRR